MNVPRSFMMALLVGCAPAVYELGESCAEDADCAEGLCGEVAEGELACTLACSSRPSCFPIGSDYACSSALGHCVRECASGLTRGSGEAMEVCQNGIFEPCSAVDSADVCDVCGCAPYGGGECIRGRGCIVQRSNGEPCSFDSDCLSGVCYRDTEMCGAPRAQGEPCNVDVECATINCSNDGDTSVAGVCNQELGSPCTPGESPACTRCVRRDFLGTTGICSRERCHPTLADHCPVVSDRVWECAVSVEGTYHCYEVCDYERGSSCYEDGAYCRGSNYCG